MAKTTLMAPPMTLSSAFETVYKTNAWQAGWSSGPGSGLSSTGAYREYLQQLMWRENITRVVDLGCGLWEHLAGVNWEGISYLGIDLVADVIKHNQEKHTTDTRQFMVGSIDDVPNLATTGLVIVKDVFQHLPNADIIALLTKLKAAPLLLVTNDITYAPNKDCVAGRWRELNLESSPFHVRPEQRFDFQSAPFVKRSLLIRNRKSPAVTEDSI